MAVPKRIDNVHSRLRRGATNASATATTTTTRSKKRWSPGVTIRRVLSAWIVVWIVWQLLQILTNDTPTSNLNIHMPIIGNDDLSPVVFVCCQRLHGEEGNLGQLSRSLYQDHLRTEIPVDVRYINAPCFSEQELQAGNPKESGQDWPIDKSFPAHNLRIFRQRIAEIHRQGGMVLAEVNCKIPQAELSNVWLESMLDPETGINGTADQTILNRFSLQDKQELRRILVQYGFESYVPKHYNETTAEFPAVLKRERAEGGVGVYIVKSAEEMKQRMSEDTRFEAMGMRHKKSRHRTIGTGWVLEEFLPGATQELIVYLRPRGTPDAKAYFWCGSHGNQRWHEDGNFVKGFADLRGTVTTPKDCSQHPELLELMSTVIKNEGIYGTGCINYKYGKDGKPKVHDWNLRTCATTSYWNKGAVFLDMINQIPRRPGTKKLALFTSPSSKQGK